MTLAHSHKQSAIDEAAQKAEERKRAKFALLYAEINKEIENSMEDEDRIVFFPVEDFEDKGPLEDFLNSRRGGDN